MPQTQNYTFFLYKQHFYKQYKAEIGKKLSKAKQHPEVELLLFENYSFFSSILSSKSSRTNSKKCAKKNYVSFNENENQNKNK